MSSVEEFFGDVWKNFLHLAGQSVAASAAKMPEVQTAVEKAKTETAKDLLWKVFPFVGIGFLIIIAARSFK